ncbi:MAG: DUF5329 family protein [Deltaproteobacteria bacterium]|nr:DUF5329 family protein [Deltaproteobacteria bacterium]MBW2504682.1 DUF5329 family protein [Deltaproteobacteria bacterium]MBW2519196.1 DUF5329 family protein [Deltaproteobacteria bacterium]
MKRDPTSPSEARLRLERKYNHMKSQIKTAEDFISKIASRSSLTVNYVR